MTTRSVMRRTCFIIHDHKKVYEQGYRVWNPGPPNAELGGGLASPPSRQAQR